MSYGVFMMNQLGGKVASLEEQIRQKDAEIARLRSDLHRQERDYLNADSERRALRDAVNAYQPEILALRAAIKPFAEAATRVQHGFREGAALVSMSDCRAALKALGEET